MTADDYRYVALTNQREWPEHYTRCPNCPGSRCPVCVGTGLVTKPTARFLSAIPVDRNPSTEARDE